MLQAYGQISILDIGTAVVNRQSVTKAYSRNRQKMIIEPRKANIKKYDAKTRNIKKEAASLRKGAEEARQMLQELGNEKLKS